MEKLPFRPALFWDTDVSALDPIKNAVFIIKRILARGDLSDFLWAKKMYDDSKIREVVLADRELDARSANFWYTYFNIDKATCIQKQSTRQQGLFWKR